MRKITARHLLHLPDLLGERHLVGISLNAASPDSVGVVFLSTENPQQYRSADGRSPRRQAKKPNRFRVHHYGDGAIHSADLPETKTNYHSVSPLVGGEWILVCHRSAFGEKNGVVYDANGQPVRAFPLGDGIQWVQTTPDGAAIWVAYFDQGVGGDDPLGQGGLNRFDTSGTPMFHFNESNASVVSFMLDCYAINVVSDTETWAYYYTDFPLVRLVNGVAVQVWQDIEIYGSHAFAVSGVRLLMSNGYKENCLHLVTLRGERVIGEKITPVTESGEPLPLSGQCFARGRFFYLPHGNDLYLLELDYDL